MEERRTERVQVALRPESAVISWDSRELLVKRLGAFPSRREVVRKFEAVGTTRPVELDLEEKAALLDLIDVWTTELREGYKALPDDLWRLRNALEDDLASEAPK